MQEGEVAEAQERDGRRRDARGRVHERRQYITSFFFPIYLCAAKTDPQFVNIQASGKSRNVRATSTIACALRGRTRTSPSTGTQLSDSPHALGGPTTKRPDTTHTPNAGARASICANFWAMSTRPCAVAGLPRRPSLKQVRMPPPHARDKWVSQLIFTAIFHSIQEGRAQAPVGPQMGAERRPDRLVAVREARTSLHLSCEHYTKWSPNICAYANVWCVGRTACAPTGTAKHSFRVLAMPSTRRVRRTTTLNTGRPTSQTLFCCSPPLDWFCEALPTDMPLDGVRSFSHSHTHTQHSSRRQPAPVWSSFESHQSTLRCPRRNCSAVEASSRSQCRWPRARDPTCGGRTSNSRLICHACACVRVQVRCAMCGIHARIVILNSIC